MEFIVDGHEYDLFNFEMPWVDGTQRLNFIHKEPDPNDPSKLVLVKNGTTNEEVLAVLIHRMKYLQRKFPCKENADVIKHLEASLKLLEHRTAERKKRGVEGKHLA